MPDRKVRQEKSISIHALRVEGDKAVPADKRALAVFLSTPSGWRATISSIFPSLSAKISIHALRVEGDHNMAEKFRFGHIISIHALRVEGDFARTSICSSFKRFLSTPSGWRATWRGRVLVQLRRISIHALRVEGDLMQLISFADRLDFYPRPPGGGRRAGMNPCRLRITISIHALRVEGDLRIMLFAICVVISIHALRVEGDAKTFGNNVVYFHFYPRPPGGGRLSLRATAKRKPKFLSTPSGWRATKQETNDEKLVHISIHALRVEGDVRQRKRCFVDLRFLSTPSGWRATPPATISPHPLSISIHALRVEGDSAC